MNHRGHRARGGHGEAQGSDPDPENPRPSGLRALANLRASVVKLHGLAVALMTVGQGCTFGESGIAPPTNRIFLPAGVVVDPREELVYVVNSNSDLRFNAGTLAVVDTGLALNTWARARKQPYIVNRPTAIPRPADPPTLCTKTRFSRTEAVPDNYCCIDLPDSNVLNCNEPQFIQSDATVDLGSFGSAIQLQDFVRDGEDVRRLFVAVRAEPSITFADVTVQAGTAQASLRCTGPRQGGSPQSPGNYCDDNWRIRRPSGVTPGALVLPEEPHVLYLDDHFDNILYVGHLTVTANAQIQGGGVSTLDVSDPQSNDSVRFAGLALTTFLPATLQQAVASLSPGWVDPDQPQTPPAIPIYAGARYSAAISGLVLRDGSSETTTAATERDLTLVPSETFYSAAFLPHGADIRSILFSPDGSKAFILHRNDSDAVANPAGIALVDRTPRADGTVSNTPLGVLEVCNGPTAMQMYPKPQNRTDRSGRIYVTCYDDGEIYVVDPNALTVTATIDAGAGPTSLVFSEVDPGFAYVASFANSHLSVIDFRPGSATENHVILRIGLPHGYGE